MTKQTDDFKEALESLEARYDDYVNPTELHSMYTLDNLVEAVDELLNAAHAMLIEIDKPEAENDEAD